ncbi:MAG: hypothetical protein PWQ67_2572 [Clostridia bacterium]|jgi:hypothetical protein|nr:hypothetical protein [Clostridia bacterium]
MSLLKAIQIILIIIIVLIVGLSLVFSILLEKNINFIKNMDLLQKYIESDNGEKQHDVNNINILGVTESGVVPDQEERDKNLKRSSAFTVIGVMFIIVLIMSIAKKTINIGDIKTIAFYIVIILSSICAGFCTGLYYLK